MGGDGDEDDEEAEASGERLELLGGMSRTKRIQSGTGVCFFLVLV